MDQYNQQTDDFFADSLGDALASGKSKAIADGEYRWRIEWIEKDMEFRANSKPIRALIFKGKDADTGEALNVSFDLTDNKGEVRRRACEMLAEQLALSGVKDELQKLVGRPLQLPIVTLAVTTNEKQYKVRTIRPCENQGGAVNAKPAAINEDADEVQPFG